ncbi:MAG: helix-turn-helix transcriptional regulator [Candidatus Lokiarchaeota archaeon]|nr:helix-turn-helix transcriptional regulator [Candidatus Lokiarchaeota archaeon]
MNRERKNIIIETLESCVDLNDVDIIQYFNELQKIGIELNKKKSFKEVFNFCSVLGNQERLKIIQSLRIKNYCVCELEAILDKSQSTISHHLRELEKIGLIRGWKKGKFTHYEVTDEKIVYYLELLKKNIKDTK